MANVTNVLTAVSLINDASGLPFDIVESGKRNLTDHVFRLINLDFGSVRQNLHNLLLLSELKAEYSSVATVCVLGLLSSI